MGVGVVLGMTKVTRTQERMGPRERSQLRKSAQHHGQRTIFKCIFLAEGTLDLQYSFFPYWLPALDVSARLNHDSISYHLNEAEV